MPQYAAFHNNVLSVPRTAQAAIQILGAHGHGLLYLLSNVLFLVSTQGAQWLSSRVLDSRPRGRLFEPHRRHCVVVLEQDTFILA